MSVTAGTVYLREAAGLKVGLTLSNIRRMEDSPERLVNLSNLEFPAAGRSITAPANGSSKPGTDYATWT